MAPSKWWQAPDDADLDYGYDSDEPDARHDSDRNTYRNTIDTSKTDTEQKGVIENMTSWLQRQAGSSQGQLATTAVLSGAAVASAIFGYQSYKRKEAVSDLKASIPKLDDSNSTGKVSSAIQAVLWINGQLQDDKG